MKMGTLVAHVISMARSIYGCGKVTGLGFFEPGELNFFRGEAEIELTALMSSGIG